MSQNCEMYQEVPTACFTHVLAAIGRQFHGIKIIKHGVDRVADWLIQKYQDD
jgi:hypothetical protein